MKYMFLLYDERAIFADAEQRLELPVLCCAEGRRYNKGVKKLFNEQLDGGVGAVCQAPIIGPHELGDEEMVEVLGCGGR